MKTYVTVRRRCLIVCGTGLEPSRCVNFTRSWCTKKNHYESFKQIIESIGPTVFRFSKLVRESVDQSQSTLANLISYALLHTTCTLGREIIDHCYSISEQERCFSKISAFVNPSIRSN